MLTQDYWTKRYADQQTGWDTGQATPPLTTYVDQLTNKDLRILIPGAGNAYEAEYLWKAGFTNVFVIDWAAEPLENLQQRCPDFPPEQLIQIDFFAFTPPEGFDLIIEQTFFCALNPNKRPAYIQKMKELLKPQGKLVGVLFQIPLNTEHPPFGGDKITYEALFHPKFDLQTLETCYNSLKPRQGNELFLIAQKK